MNILYYGDEPGHVIVWNGLFCARICTCYNPPMAETSPKHPTSGCSSPMYSADHMSHDRSYAETEENSTSIKWRIVEMAMPTNNLSDWLQESQNRLNISLLPPKKNVSGKMFSGSPKYMASLAAYDTNIHLSN